MQCSRLSDQQAGFQAADALQFTCEGTNMVPQQYRRHRHHMIRQALIRLQIPRRLSHLLRRLPRRAEGPAGSGERLRATCDMCTPPYEHTARLNVN